MGLMRFPVGFPKLVSKAEFRGGCISPFSRGHLQATRLILLVDKNSGWRGFKNSAPDGGDSAEEENSNGLCH
jgi:hypothetical protein